MSLVPVILITACCFLAAILSLALSANFKNRVMGVCGAIAITVGIVSYSYAYTWNAGFSVAAVLKALLTVCRMFGGVNDFGSVAATPLFQSHVAVAVFWLGHFLAFYITASAAIEVLGRRLLKYIRLRLLRRGDLRLVYDAAPETLPLARSGGKGTSFVLVAEGDGSAMSGVAESVNGVLFTGGTTACASEGFLKGLGVQGGQRNLDVFCLGRDGAQNLRYAEALLPGLEARGVKPDATSLFLLGIPEGKAAHLQAGDGCYGYGTVFACDRYELIARLAVQMRPPWTCLSYDAAARATSDFSVIVVGFGWMGRAVLKQMVINGQMEGSAFRAEVFDRRMEDLKGYMSACFPELLKAYDIRLNVGDGDSPAFFDSLAARTPSIIALCTGDRKQNAELAQDLERLYNGRAERPCVMQCDGDAVIVDGAEYRLGSVDVRGMDRAAMVLNHAYCNGPSPEEDWRGCDPFSRASSRASADFFPAFLQAAGLSREDVLAGKWPPPPEVLENLARTEHLRWCAFHLAMGYSPMSPEEFQSRAERYRRGELSRISKDAAGRTHACLAPWDELDDLSARENAVTGGSVDYKSLDRSNVLAIPEIIRRIG